MHSTPALALAGVNPCDKFISLTMKIKHFKVLVTSLNGTICPRFFTQYQFSCLTAAKKKTTENKDAHREYVKCTARDNWAATRSTFPPCSCECDLSAANYELFIISLLLSLDKLWKLNSLIVFDYDSPEAVFLPRASAGSTGKWRGWGRG